MTLRADAAITAPQTPHAAAAASRSRMYALLAEALSFPQGPVLERLRDATSHTDLKATAAQLPEPLAVPAPAADAAGMSAESASTLYTRLFHASGTRPAVSMSEHRYRAREGSPKPLWEDLLRYYRHFGLDFTEAGVRESPDHLLVELEFMHYLCYLEAGAAAGTADLRRGQRDFLRVHLAAWTGEFAAALARHAPHGPYAAAASLLADFVESDLRCLERDCD